MHNKVSKKIKGFTLIELLIVIAIIGILAAVVLVSLSNTKKKSRDSVIRQQVSQFKNLLDLEYSTSGSYSSLFTGDWIPYSPTYNCANSFSSVTYAASATALCNDIVNNSENPGSWADVRFFVGTGSIAQSYSIRAWLPFKRMFLCVGSNGKNSETTDISEGQGGLWTDPGCPTESPW